MTEFKNTYRARSLLAGCAAVSTMLLLAGCSYPDWANPVEWYRGVIGTAEDDPKGAEPNAKNLEAGSQEPYPSLATVPAPPTDALSSEERDKLRQSLIADRAHAAYVDNNDQYTAAAPQAVPGPVATPAPAATAPGPNTPGTRPQPSTTAAGPPGATNSPSIAAQHPLAPSRQRRTASGAGTAGAQPQTPQESSLTPPTIPDLPQGDQPRGAPPAPGTAPRRPAAASPRQTAALPPQAAPSAATAAAPPAAPQGLTMTVGVVRFAGNSARIGPGELQQIQQAAQLRQQNGGIIRVTAYSVPSSARDEATAELAGFGLAMDRARAVAEALTKAGVPARAVEVGAAPAPLGDEGDVAALTLEY